MGSSKAFTNALAKHSQGTIREPRCWADEGKNGTLFQQRQPHVCGLVFVNGGAGLAG
jgi:hypothetical protein